LVSNLQFSGENRYPDFDRLRAELGSWRTYYLDPREAMREAQTPREATDIGSRGESIASFLYRLKVEDPPRFKAVRRALRSAIPSVEDLDVDLDPGRGTLDIIVQQGGVTYSSRIVSEGTLRVLALCAISANPWPNTLIAFEEPENGVHPRRIEVITELLAGIARSGRRQVIVTTHSPELVRCVAEMAMAAARDGEPAKVLLLRCTQDSRGSRLAPFNPAPLFQDEEIRTALTGPEDRIIEAMLVRGWLDG